MLMGGRGSTVEGPAARVPEPMLARQRRGESVCAAEYDVTTYSIEPPPIARYRQEGQRPDGALSGVVIFDPRAVGAGAV